MKADVATEAAVLATLNAFTETYRQRDMDSLMTLFAPDSDVVFIGTGADEWRVGQAEIQAQGERDWAQSETASLDLTWTPISAVGTIAWAAAKGGVRVTAGGQEVTLPIRMTVVLEQRGDKWFFVQMHASFPAGEQAEGQSWPTD